MMCICVFMFHTAFDPLKSVPDMTYNVFGGTLSLTQSIDQMMTTL